MMSRTPSWMLTASLRPASLISLLAAALLACAGGCQSKSADPLDREMWEVLRIGEAGVGYGRANIRREEHNGDHITRIEGLNHIKFRRAGREIALEVEFTSRQTPDGRLLDFISAISQGPEPLNLIQETRGTVVGNALEIETTTLGRTASSSIEWKPEYGGPMASQLSLWKNPMTPGEKRLVHEFVPAANVVGASQLAAADYETVEVLGATPFTQKLLRIDVTTTFPNGRNQQSTLWTDPDGDVLRTHQQAMNLDTFRTSKEVALAAIDRTEFDMVLGLSVDLARAIPRAHDTTRIHYRLQLDDDDPAAVFPSCLSQQVNSVDTHTAEVTVYAIRPGRHGNPDAEPDEPDEGDREPNVLVQSDDPKIVAAAAEVRDSLPPDLRNDTWQLAVALERYVHEKITEPDYAQAFDSAAEVMASGKGDCTEHAVLLAALARACGIPARVVVGLVYTEQTGRPAFGYHMWNELWIADRWIAMDATLAHGGVGASHLKLAESDLAGASAFSSFLPVAQVAGRLKIEVEEIQ